MSANVLAFPPPMPKVTPVPPKGATLADKIQWFTLEEPHVMDMIHGQLEYMLHKRRALVRKGGAQ
jgi:hypothetical protein